MPKWPCSSGPVRKELGRCTLIWKKPAPAQSGTRHPEVRGIAAPRRTTAQAIHPSRLASLAPRDDAARGWAVRSYATCCNVDAHCFPRGVDERADFIGILLSWRALDAGGNIDGGR